MRRMLGPILGVALVAATAGAVSAGNPNRSASLSACWSSLTGGLQLHVDWAAYHPDTLTPVATQAGSSAVTAYPTNRSADWKFGTATWDTSPTTWSDVGVTLTTGTTVAVDLYGKGKFLGETNAVDTGSLGTC